MRYGYVSIHFETRNWLLQNIHFLILPRSTFKYNIHMRSWERKIWSSLRQTEFDGTYVFHCRFCTCSLFPWCLFEILFVILFPTGQLQQRKYAEDLLRSKVASLPTKTHGTRVNTNGKAVKRGQPFYYILFTGIILFEVDHNNL